MGISWFKRKFFYMGQLREVKEIDEKSQDNNTVIKNHQILNIYQGFKGCHHAFYVPYNFKYYDKGWGCAWRAIQMVLSAYYKPQDILKSQGTIDFKKLFHGFAKKEKLDKIIDSLYPKHTAAKIKESTYSPEQVANNWAQPFICHLICHEKKINSRLLLLNDYPYANAPQQAFEQKIINFAKFITLIDQHIQHSPVMIDDGIISMSILAYKKGQQNSHQLIIGDPHILSNQKNKMEVGIYKIVLDQQGKKIKHQIDPQVFKQAYCDNITKIDFSKKAWMFMVTQKNQ